MLSHHLFVALLFFFSLCFSAAVTAMDAETESKHLKTALRMVGHQVLLQAGDSTSRVMPVQQEEGRYRISFSSEFFFRPEELVETVLRVVEETNMPGNYILEVEHCSSGAVVYSFAVNAPAKEEIIPCRGRVLPKACYQLVFNVIDYEKISRASVPESTEDNRILYGSLLLLLLGGGWFAYFKTRKARAKDSELITIGQFQFDHGRSVLILRSERIELTGKEAALLQLLHESQNTTVERDNILREVWGDDGDYVGRTLDVFISKLRKKLEGDPMVKIMNVRGVGYKLVIDA